MAEFLTNRGVNSYIEGVLTNAKEKLILVSPYISFIQNDYVERIKYALEHKVRVVLICRNSFNIHHNEIEKLRGLKGLEFFEHPDLHAKAYFNEREAVVTSFNLSGASEANNIEFGMYFTLEKAKESFERLARETDGIIRQSSIVSLDRPAAMPNLVEGLASFKFEGVCIRCGHGIDFNPAKPFCRECYDIWRQYGNYLFVEKHCHQCSSKNRSTSMAQPICEECRG